MSIWALLYHRGKLTAAQIWAKVDAGLLTEDEAVKICGTRP